MEMGTLIERCQRRADKENNDHIDGPEWRALISEVWGSDLFQVVADTGLRYFETSADLLTTGVAYVSEPTNIAKTIGLYYVDSAGRLTELQELMIHEVGPLVALGSGTARFFALVDNLIYLYPTPPTGQTYRMLYVPQAPDISGYADDACVDVVSADGEACVIWGVAALAKVKASQDASLHLQRQDLHRNRLEAWAADRAITQARLRPAADEYAERAPYCPGDYR